MFVWEAVSLVQENMHKKARSNQFATKVNPIRTFEEMKELETVNVLSKI